MLKYKVTVTLIIAENMDVYHPCRPNGLQQYLCYCYCIIIKWQCARLSHLSVSVTVIVLYVASTILLGNLDAEGVQSLLLISNYYPPLDYIVYKIPIRMKTFKSIFNSIYTCNWWSIKLECCGVGCSCSCSYYWWLEHWIAKVK